MGSHGTYNLTGGTFAMTNLFLNAGGIFNQTGGTLNYTTFYHQGGDWKGTLVNQSAYIYSGGLFSGRLLNYGTGTVTFNADFIATMAWPTIPPTPLPWLPAAASPSTARVWKWIKAPPLPKTAAA